MLRKITLIMFVLVLSLMVAVPAFADPPDFTPHIYADGEAWGTKVTTTLPAPQGTTSIHSTSFSSSPMARRVSCLSARLHLAVDTTAADGGLGQPRGKTTYPMISRS